MDVNNTLYIYIYIFKWLCKCFIRKEIFHTFIRPQEYTQYALVRDNECRYLFVYKKAQFSSYFGAFNHITESSSA